MDIDQEKLDKMAEQFRKNKEAALKTGLVLHKLSARRYEVLRLVNPKSWYGDGGFWSTETLFGPDTKEACLRFIEAELLK